MSQGTMHSLQDDAFAKLSRIALAFTSGSAFIQDDVACESLPFVHWQATQATREWRQPSSAWLPWVTKPAWSGNLLPVSQQAAAG